MKRWKFWRRNRPACQGVYSYTSNGNEFDCRASPDAPPCEDCLVNYDHFRGRWNPETGKQVGKLKAYVCYGWTIPRYSRFDWGWYLRHSLCVLLHRAVRRFLKRPPRKRIMNVVPHNTTGKEKR